MHYTPNGKEAKDKSQVGLVFYKGKEPPKRIAQTRGITNNSFRDSARRCRITSSNPSGSFLAIRCFCPSCRTCTCAAKISSTERNTPTGSTEILLTVPHYDFGWQTSYRLAEPLRLPKGTKIHCIAHFDNSAGNPANPDSKKEVTWGDQTWEEMMIGWVDYVWEQPEHEAMVEGFKAF